MYFLSCPQCLGNKEWVFSNPEGRGIFLMWKGLRAATENLMSTTYPTIKYANSGVQPFYSTKTRWITYLPLNLFPRNNYLINVSYSIMMHKFVSDSYINGSNTMTRLKYSDHKNVLSKMISRTYLISKYRLFQVTLQIKTQKILIFLI
jgi:hypothetical protein